MHEVLVNPLGGLSLPRKSVVRYTDRPDMTLGIYRGRKTTMQQQQQQPDMIEILLKRMYKCNSSVQLFCFVSPSFCFGSHKDLESSR